MGKTNFTKVEEALRDGLDKMLKDKLLEEADTAQGKAIVKQHAVDEMVAKIRHLLKFLKKSDKDLFSKIEIDEKGIKELLKLKTFSSNDLVTLKEVLQKIEKYRKELAKTNPPLNDEEIITSELKKQPNRRYNIRDDWLPLK